MCGASAPSALSSSAPGSVPLLLSGELLPVPAQELLQKLVKLIQSNKVPVVDFILVSITDFLTHDPREFREILILTVTESQPSNIFQHALHISGLNLKGGRYIGEVADEVGLMSHLCQIIAKIGIKNLPNLLHCIT